MSSAGADIASAVAAPVISAPIAAVSALAAPAVGNFIGGITDKLKAPNAPALQNPTTNMATQAQASTTATQNALAKEKNSVATSTLLTGGGAGLLDEPTTTSRVLLGS